MNKYKFFAAEITAMLDDNAEKDWVAHAIQMSEIAIFLDAIDCGEVTDKDFEPIAASPKDYFHNFPAEFDDFDPLCWSIAAEYSTKALHRKHRKSCRMAKDKRRKNSHWMYYYDGTAKECKTKNHKAVRREYDIPIGKSNFYHKVSSYEYFW